MYNKENRYAFKDIINMDHKNAGETASLTDQTTSIDKIPNDMIDNSMKNKNENHEKKEILSQLANLSISNVEQGSSASRYPQVSNLMQELDKMDAALEYNQKTLAEIKDIQKKRIAELQSEISESIITLHQFWPKFAASVYEFESNFFKDNHSRINFLIELERERKEVLEKMKMDKDPKINPKMDLIDFTEIIMRDRKLQEKFVEKQNNKPVFPAHDEIINYYKDMELFFACNYVSLEFPPIPMNIFDSNINFKEDLKKFLKIDKTFLVLKLFQIVEVIAPNLKEYIGQLRNEIISNESKK